jgi:hypothetical protein
VLVFVSATLLGGRTLDEKRSKLLANVAWIALIAYTLVLLLLTLDQFLGWGIWPPKLDRMLNEHIAQLGDPKLSPDKKEEIAKYIVSWHEFSVPLLINAIEKNKPGVRDPATKCIQDIAREFFNDESVKRCGSDPKELRKWWSSMQDYLEGKSKKPA